MNKHIFNAVDSVVGNIMAGFNPAIQTVPTVDSDSTGTKLSDHIDLSSMTKDELLAVAAEMKMKVAKSWTKTKIIDALSQAA